MAVTTTNLIQGAATLYIGNLGATEPTDTDLTTDPATPDWTDVGGTNDGVKLSVDQSYTELEVDQLVDRVGSRLTKRDITVETTLAEPTLVNLTWVMNSGTVSSGSGWQALEPEFATSATQPKYRALLFDGYAPGQLRRRVIVRKVLSTDAFEMAYTKEDKTTIPVKWAAHYVSPSVAPFRIVDEKSAA
ncbi:hypothetical protein [Streptomyces sp. NPDC056291]|uniref:phage tail tube protein n=1 Tax=Streptomyces sp. NPDC056291 TaxID=3345772 RepID=UPI0035D9B23E